MASKEIRQRGAAEEAADAAMHHGVFEDAEPLLQQALEHYRLVRDAHREGRALLKLAVARMYENPNSALPLFTQAESLFDANAEPILACCSRHHRIWCLNDLGQPAEALALLDRSKPLYRRYRRLDLVTRQLHWLEARIDLRLGRYREAEDRLRLLLKQLLHEIKDPDELVLVAVDLVRSLAVQEGKTGQAIALVDHLCTLFDPLGLHPLRLAVWIKLGQQLGEGLALDWDAWDVIQDFFRCG